MGTSKKSIGPTLFDLTSYVADTRVNLSVRLESGEVKKIRAICGRGYETPLAHFNLATQSWRMFEGISRLVGQLSLASLPTSGMTRNGVLYPQPPWEPITGATASSSWPTPTAVTRPMEGNVRLYRAKVEAGEMTEEEATAILGKSPFEAQGKIPATWPTPTTQDHIERKSTQQKPGSRHSVGLGDAVRMWPTPTTQEVEHPDAELTDTGRRKSKDGTTSHSLNLADAVKMWPTPTAVEWKGRGPNSKQQGLAEYVKMWPTPTADEAKNAYSTTSQFNNLRTQVGASPQTGKLNPTWVEWLMGFPTGWTDLED